MTTSTFCAPAYEHIPPHVGTYGDEVADLAVSVGLDLDPEQRLAIDAMYAHDARGRLVAAEFGCAAPRQNIKTHIGKAASLADLVLFDEPMGLWTAHLRSTSDKTFAELVDLFENYDHLRRLVHSIPDSDGEKGIRLHRPVAGAPHPELLFMTRSERGGRGLTGRRVTFDEALFLKPAMTSAMVPVLSAQSMTGAVQVRYLGSAGIAKSDVWRAVRDRGRRGDARSLVWLEWMAPPTDCATEQCRHEVGTEGCALDRPDLIAAANLALDRRIDLNFVLETEREALSAEDYMRERFGWWEEPAPTAADRLPTEIWAALRDDDSVIVGRPEFAIDVTPDRSRSTLGAVGAREDGLAHAEILRNDRGTAWVVEALDAATRKAGHRKVILDASGPAGSLVADIEALGIEVFPASRAEIARACGALVDAATGDRLRHLDQYELNNAIDHASTKDLGDGAWVWHRQSSLIDISPLYVVTLALYAHQSRDATSTYEERDMLVIG